MKSLIVYFSHRHENYVNGNIVELEKGNTQVIANQIHEMIESNIFEIEPLHEYPVHYHDCTELAKKELETQARPKVKNIIPHFEHYQKIYLGFPNWWSTMPMCVWTFLESYDFDGKDIYPFVTHEGSGFGKSIQDLKMLIPYANIHQGLAIYGHQVQDSFKQIQKWVGDSNGNNKKS